jgi:hypothetical protein
MTEARQNSLNVWEKRYEHGLFATERPQEFAIGRPTTARPFTNAHALDEYRAL